MVINKVLFEKMKHTVLKIIILTGLLNSIVSQADDDLSINMLPSDKYKINKRDLVNLKSDIERQVK
jgi:hypothetical protein